MSPAVQGSFSLHCNRLPSGIPSQLQLCQHRPFNKTNGFHGFRICRSRCNAIGLANRNQGLPQFYKCSSTDHAQSGHCPDVLKTILIYVQASSKVTTSQLFALEESSMIPPGDDYEALPIWRRISLSSSLSMGETFSFSVVLLIDCPLVMTSSCDDSWLSEITR